MAQEGQTEVALLDVAPAASTSEPTKETGTEQPKPSAPDAPAAASAQIDDQPDAAPPTAQATAEPVTKKKAKTKTRLSRCQRAALLWMLLSALPATAFSIVVWVRYGDESAFCAEFYSGYSTAMILSTTLAVRQLQCVLTLLCGATDLSATVLRIRLAITVYANLLHTQS